MYVLPSCQLLIRSITNTKTHSEFEADLLPKLDKLQSSFIFFHICGQKYSRISNSFISLFVLFRVV